MANAHANKVVINGVTKIDLTGDTVTPQTLMVGETAHDASGAVINGAMSYCNRNLLDNPWFTVNQRRWTTGDATNKYTADRWLTRGYSQTVTVNGNGLSISGSPWLEQKLENPTQYVGKNMTFSVLLQNGDLWHGTAQIVNGRNEFFVQLFGGLYIAGELRTDEACVRILNYVGTPTSSPLQIRAVKLELGTVSTLALDLPPDYATELLKCQRYCFVMGAEGNNYDNFGVGYASQSDASRILINLPVQLRANPSLTAIGNFNITNNGQHAVTSLSVRSRFSNLLVLTVMASGVTANNLSVLSASDQSDAMLIFSADL